MNWSGWVIAQLYVDVINRSSLFQGNLYVVGLCALGSLAAPVCVGGFIEEIENLLIVVGIVWALRVGDFTCKTGS